MRPHPIRYRRRPMTLTRSQTIVRREKHQRRAVESHVMEKKRLVCSRCRKTLRAIVDGDLFCEAG